MILLNTKLSWDNCDRPRIAQHFNQFGMLLTRICGEKDNDRSYKDPAEKWEAEEQTDVFLQNRDWNNATGIGIMLGHNCYRAIDIDDIAEAIKLYHHNCGLEIFDIARRELINNCLRLLGLPSTYEWVVRSPKGFHIIFRAKSVAGMPDSISYKPNAYFSKDNAEQLSFSRIELLWSTHLVMAPSEGIKQNWPYAFENCVLPKGKPSYVDIGQIDDLLNFFCGFTGFANKIDVGYDTYRISGALFFRALIKERAYRGSFEELEDYRESQQLPYSNSCRVLQFGGLDSNTNWLRACATPEAYNKLGIISYIVDDSVDSATKYFNQSKSGNSFYNQACLISLNKQDGDISQMLSYLTKSSAEKSLIDLLRIHYYHSHKRIPKILFISLCTTARVDEMDSLEEGDALPKLLECSWMSTDMELNVMSIYSCYMKPEGFMIPVHVSKAGGLTHDLARKYGTESWDISVGNLINAIDSANIVISFDAEFDITILRKIADSVDLPISHIPEGWAEKNVVCLKWSAAPAMKDVYGYLKNPSLMDLYEYLTGDEYLRSKDSRYNVGCLLRIYSKLKQRNCDFAFYRYDSLPF